MQNKITIEGTLSRILKSTPGKNGNTNLSFLIERGGTVPQKYIISSYASIEQYSAIEDQVSMPVVAECYLNGKQFTDGSDKYYNELKLIAFK